MVQARLPSHNSNKQVECLDKRNNNPKRVVSLGPLLNRIRSASPQPEEDSVHKIRLASGLRNRVKHLEEPPLGVAVYLGQEVALSRPHSGLLRLHQHSDKVGCQLLLLEGVCLVDNSKVEEVLVLKQVDSELLLLLLLAVEGCLVHNSKEQEALVLKQVGLEEPQVVKFQPGLQPTNVLMARYQPCTINQSLSWSIKPSRGNQLKSSGGSI